VLSRPGAAIAPRLVTVGFMVQDVRTHARSRQMIGATGDQHAGGGASSEEPAGTAPPKSRPGLADGGQQNSQLGAVSGIRDGERNWPIRPQHGKAEENAGEPPAAGQPILANQMGQAGR